MSESQHTEWKEFRRDQYLRWARGLANVDGGMLVVGKKGKGAPVGVSRAKKPLVYLPDKLLDVSRIMAEVRLIREGVAHLVEIPFARHPYPLSYESENHFQSSITKQQLKGAAFDKFLLKEQGHSWYGVPIPNVPLRSLQKSAVKAFRTRVHESQRVTTTVLKEQTSRLVEKLNAKHPSQPFSQNLGNDFFWAGEIEARCRSIECILPPSPGAKYPEPIIEYEATCLRVKFSFSDDIVALPYGAASGQRPGVTPQKTPEKILASRLEFSSADVGERFGSSQRAVQRAAAKLVLSGKLQIIGPDMGGCWEVER